MRRTIYVATLLYAAFVLFNSPFASAQESPEAPALWTGSYGLGMKPGTLREYPGRHARGNVLYELDLAYVRTGRLAVDFVAPQRTGEFRVPAGTRMFSTRFFMLRLAPPGGSQRGPNEPEAAAETNHWCALPEPDGFVCFFWSASGQVFYNARYVGGANIDDRAPSLSFEPGPAPQIAEQHVEIGTPRHVQYTLTDFDDEGFVLSLVRTKEPGAPSRPFTMPRVQWGEYRGHGYSRGIVMQVAPLRGADGAIHAAQVNFSSSASQ